MVLLLNRYPVRGFVTERECSAGACLRGENV
jgi:hypothetical protein